MSSVRQKIISIKRISSLKLRKSQPHVKSRTRSSSFGQDLIQNNCSYSNEEPSQFKLEGTIDSPLVSDLTPFIQGLYFNVTLIATSEVLWNESHKDTLKELVSKSIQAQSSTEPIAPLGGTSTYLNKEVSVKVMTLTIKIKDRESRGVEYTFPISRLTYCGTDSNHSKMFVIVTKEQNPYSQPTYLSYLFKCQSSEKAHAMALCVAKAYHLTFLIWQEEQGVATEHPERTSIFEPIPSSSELANIRKTPEMLRKKLEEVLSTPLSTANNNNSNDNNNNASPVDTDPQLDGASPPVIKKEVGRRPSVMLSEHGDEISETFANRCLATPRPGMIAMDLEMTDILRQWSMGNIQKHSDPGSREFLNDEDAL